MRRIAITLIFTISLGAMPIRAAEECVCRMDGGTVNVGNFPATQQVVVQKVEDRVEVKETDLTRVYTTSLDLGTGEKRPLGPFPLDGRRRATLQISQVAPKTGIPALVTARWYVRFNAEDAFFDPCPKEQAGLCTTGFARGGAKLRPILPSTQAEVLESFYITEAPVSVAVIDVTGTESLLVIENAGASPRTLRVQLVLDR